ncbi:hypothetical protein EI555_007432, partial [Monodon monoceros]
PFCFLFAFLPLISARTIRRISVGFLQFEILWPLHVRIVQYFTKGFQREPMFLRFTDQGVESDVLKVTFSRGSLFQNPEGHRNREGAEKRAFPAHCMAHFH